MEVAGQGAVDQKILNVLVVLPPTTLITHCRHRCTADTNWALQPYSCHQTSHRQPLHTTRVSEPSRHQCCAGFAGWYLSGVSFVLVLRGLTDSVRLTLGLMGLNELHPCVLAASLDSQPCCY